LEQLQQPELSLAVVARSGRALTGMIDIPVEAVEGSPAEDIPAEGNLAEDIPAEDIPAEGSEDRTTFLLKRKAADFFEEKVDAESREGIYTNSHQRKDLLII
jgi:hypothetical protein